MIITDHDKVYLRNEKNTAEAEICWEPNNFNEILFITMTRAKIMKLYSYKKQLVLMKQ